MWIAHKSKEGDTLASIVKQYKTKDPKAILQYPKNRAVSKALAKKEPLKAGLVVWVPDPKVKVYLLYDGKGNKQVLTEKQFNDYKKKAHAAMDQVMNTQQKRYYSIYESHMKQRHYIVEHWFVSSYVEPFNSVNEPNNHQKIADNAMKLLTKAVKGRAYGAFEKEAIYAENMMQQYHRGVSDWISGSVGSGEKVVSVLEAVKGAGLFCAGMVAVTVAAPSGLMASVLFGAASAVTFGATYDGADALGRGIAGTKQMSSAEWQKRVAVNGLSGAASGAISSGVLSKVTKPLFAKLMTKTMSSGWAKEVASRSVVSKLFQREMEFVATKIWKKGGGLTIDCVIEDMAVDKVLEITLLKFINRMASGGLVKLLKSDAVLGERITKWAKDNPKKLAGKDGQKIGDSAAIDLATPDLANELFDILLKKNIGVFQKDLRAALEKPAAEAEKRLLAAQ